MKIQKPQKLFFFLIKPHNCSLFLRYFLGFRFYVSYTTKNRSKIGTASSQTVSIHSVQPLLRLWKSWDFGILSFLGEVKIFLISGGLFYDGGGRLYLLEGGHFILCPFYHFELQDCKNSKIFACDALIINFHIFRFTMDAGFEVDIHFNTESKFPCSRSSFFSPSLGTQNQSTIHLVDLEGSLTHPPSKARAFLCKCKQIWQLLVKTKSHPFLNKRPVYNTKDSFEEQGTDLLSLTDKPLIRQHFIKIFIKKLGSFYILYVNMFYLVLLLVIDILDRQI